MLRNLLVGAEIALAVVLLVGAGLMVRGFRYAVDTASAWSPRPLLTMRLATHRQQVSRTPPAARPSTATFSTASAPCPVCAPPTAVTAHALQRHSNWRDFSPSRASPWSRATAPIGDVPGGQPRGISRPLHVPLRAGRFLTDSDGPDAPAGRAHQRAPGAALVERRVAHRQAHQLGAPIPRAPG